MQNIYLSNSLRSVFTLALLFLFSSLFSVSLPTVEDDNQVFNNTNIATVEFSLDECYSNLKDDSPYDFSEFTAEINNTEFATLTSTPGLYRNDARNNGHSCTPGMDGSVGLCVDSYQSCEFLADSDKAIRFGVTVSPAEGELVALGSLSFYALAPELFNYIDGPSGTNNYPDKLGLRVLKDGVEIQRITDLNTEQEWTYEIFNFKDNAEFMIDSEATFDFEILGYCSAGIESFVNIWDIDEVRLGIYQVFDIDGGTLSGGPFEFCVGDGMADFIASNEIELTGAQGTNRQWVITDAQGVILGLPNTFADVDFDGAGSGECLIWHLSFDGTIEGLAIDANANDLSGCFSLSNPLSVSRNQPAGGVLSSEPFEFCVGDGVADMIPSGAIALTNESGPNSQWLITDEEGMILGAPMSYEDVNFDGAGAGVCLVWHISYFGELMGLAVGQSANNIQGCFSLSNSISVIRNQPEGGVLAGGPFEFCVGDGEADMIPAGSISISGVIGANSQWVITDESGVILGLPEDYENADFDGAGEGTCLVWHLSYFDTLSGLTMGQNVADISGCYNFSSNSISVNRLTEGGPCGPIAEGGRLAIAGDTLVTIDICAGDMVSDAFDVTLIGASGDSSAWLITDTEGMILGLPADPPFDLEGAGAGVCLIWHLSYNDSITGLSVGARASDLIGDFDLSNPITVNRTGVDGGSLSGGPFEFCVGDGIVDNIQDGSITLTNSSGDSSLWLITDVEGMILGVPMSYSDVNFDGAGAGVCLVWHVSYSGELTGLNVGDNASDIGGCFSLSNSISVTRNQPEGGMLTGGPFTFCVDGEADFVSGVSVSDQSGDTSRWVITDEAGKILGLPMSPEAVDFDGAGAGVCLIWNISYAEGLEGLEVDSLVSNLSGCYALSNSVTVTRFSTGGPCSPTAVGGSLTVAGDTLVTVDICAGDGTADPIAVTLSGAAGDSSAWVITDATGKILGLPMAPPFDLEGAGAGVCLIWHLSYNGTLSGVAVDSNANEIMGDFSLSNPITVNRTGVAGGMLTGGPFTFCVDGEADFVSGVSVSDQSGDTSRWVITDEAGKILGLPMSPEAVDFDGAGAGVCLIWNISYADGLEGLEVDSLVSNLSGCYALSNSVTVTRLSTGGPCSPTAVGGSLTVAGDTLVTVDICAGDGTADPIAVTLSGAAGDSSAWVITDATGKILGLPMAPPFDLEGAGAGVCLIWHLSYNGTLSGVAVDSNANEIMGDFSLSNPITVNRTGVAGGMLTGGPFTFCVDGEADFVSGVSVSDQSGDTSRWVITDEAGKILGLPMTPEVVDFDGAGAGVCLIWNISYADGLEGLEVDSLVSNLSGCYALSNSVTVTRLSTGGPCSPTAVGGALTVAGDTLVTVDICAGDGTADPIAVTLSGAAGDSSAWVITDATGKILGLPMAPPFDLEGAGAGVCLIWHLSYNGTLSGVAVDSNANEIMGDFSLSNPITVNRTGVAGGMLTGGPFTFCVDGEADFVSGVSASDQSGDTSRWVITDEAGKILGLPMSPEAVDFDGAGAGVCLIWNISYAEGLEGLEVDSLVSNLSGCYALSNSVTVTRLSTGGPCSSTAVGGSLTVAGDTLVTVDICAGDGTADPIAVTLSGAAGDSSAWVITDATGKILGLPMAPPFDLEGAGAGVCLIWHLSYNGTLSGVAVDSNANEIMGDFSLSNPITVNRTGVAGGMLTGGPFTFCVDGEADFVSGVALTGAEGALRQWVVTDQEGFILGIPASLQNVNFDDAGPGTCFIFNVSYTDTTTQFAMGANIASLQGCYDLSTPVTVNRQNPDGGDLTGGPFSFCIDDTPDFTSGIELINASGTNSSWVITDTLGEILGLPLHPDSVDFNAAGAGVCQIWHLSYSNGLIGLSEGNNVSDLMGCFSFSNSLVVIRSVVDGGVVSGSNFEFCIDGTSDFVSGISVSGAEGANSTWVITDDIGKILGIPADPTTVDFDQAGVGTCLIWHLSYADSIQGLEVNNNVSSLIGCFDFSNFITVIRSNSGESCTQPMGIPVINEILGNGRVEIRNAGNADIDISNYWLCDQPAYDQLSTLDIECGDLMLSPGELVTVVTTNISISGTDGEMGLYRDNNFTSTSSIVDYVEWGSTGHGRSSVAVSAGIWPSGGVAPIFPTNMSLIYDGDGDEPTDWSEGASSPCDINTLGGIVGQWKVMGNPFSNRLKMEVMSATAYNTITVQIRSLQGTLIKTHQVLLDKDMNYIDLDLTEMQDGIYLVHMLSPSIKKVEKVVKQSK